MDKKNMSYTHTLSIQGVHANLQMNVEHSAVSYVLTLRADSGEEVVANGRLPNDAMDNFIVLNQHFKNPEVVKNTSEQGVQTGTQQSVQQRIMTDIFDFIIQGQQQQKPLIQENQLHSSQSNMAAPQSSECLNESLSPVLPSTPRNMAEIPQEPSVVLDNPIEKKEEVMLTHEEWLAAEHIGPHDQKKVDLFFDLAATLTPTISFLATRKYYRLYQEWRQQGTHPNLNRWKAMEFWLRNLRPSDE